MMNSIESCSVNISGLMKDSLCANSTPANPVIAAQSMGVNLAVYKTSAFAYSAALMGVAGALFAHKIGFLAPDIFTVLLSIQFLLMDDEGFVRITDRMKDIIITAGGKNVTPSEIENQLKFSPYISDAVVIGDQRKFLSCLVMIDHETVAQFAQERNVPFTNFASLCRTDEVQRLIGGEIDRVNRQLARVETIKKFRLIEQILTAEDEELTPTMKLKRAFVNRKYKDVIDAMYAEA